MGALFSSAPTAINLGYIRICGAYDILFVFVLFCSKKKKKYIFIIYIYTFNIINFLKCLTKALCPTIDDGPVKLVECGLILMRSLNDARIFAA